MADLFGTPLGQIAKEEQNRKNVLAESEAWKTLGEIEAMPEKVALSRAHTRLYNATAADKETEALQMQMLGGAAEGAFEGATSLATPFARLSAIAGGMRMPKKAAEFAEKASTIALHEQQLLTSKSNEELHKINADEKRAEGQASWALSILNDPDPQAAWDREKMKLSSQGHNVIDLPPSVEQAVPTLQGLVTQGQKAKDVLAAKAKKLVDDANVVRYGAQAAAASASAGASRARARVLTQQADDVDKHDGDTTGGARDARKTRGDASKENIRLRQDALVAKQYALMPPPTQAQIDNPSKLRMGQFSMFPAGPHVWLGPDKKWVPLEQYKKTSPAAAAKVKELETQLADEED